MIDLSRRHNRGSCLQQIKKRRVNFPLAWNPAKRLELYGRCAYDNTMPYFTLQWFSL